MQHLIIEPPRVSLEKILREGEHYLCEELREGDRKYLTKILDESVSVQPTDVLREVQVLISLAERTTDLDGRPDFEIVSLQTIAHRLMVVIGWFPTTLATDEVLPSVTFSRNAFGKLASCWEDEGERKLLRRFQEDYMTYVDVLLAAHNLHEPHRLPRGVLRPLAECGSKYAHGQLSSSKRH